MGTSDGFDIIGKIFNSQGQVVRDSFQVNSAFIVDDEANFDVAATNDGGFVMVFVDDDIANVDETAIVWERYNASGNRTHFASIASEAVAGTTYTNPTITVELNSNLSYISYEIVQGSNSDIMGRVVDPAGIVGPPLPFAPNGTDNNYNNALAVLTTGSIVSTYIEVDSGVESVEVRLIAPSTSSFIKIGLNSTSSSDPQVAALSNGNVVITWTEGNDIYYNVRSSNLDVVVGRTAIGTAASNLHETSVIALPQGGFVVIYDHDSTNNQRAQLCTNSGVPVGSEVVFANVDGTTPTVSATADGRILFTYNTSANVFH